MFTLWELLKNEDRVKLQAMFPVWRPEIETLEEVEKLMKQKPKKGVQ